MSEHRAIAELIVQPDALRIRWSDGTDWAFAAEWLRDHLSDDRDAASGQRLADAADLPDDPRIRAAWQERDRIRVQWEGADPPAGYGVEWLRQRAADALAQDARPMRYWLDGAMRDARRDFTWIGLEQLRGDAGAREAWLDGLLRDGLAFVSGVACSDGGILSAVERIGRIVDTNYGTVFDVRTVALPENLAYSDLGLGLHTDNPYRNPVPGFQALHVMAASAEGGSSLFADGFALARHLRDEVPAAFATLTGTPVAFRYRSADAELAARRPLIALDCLGRVEAVHYNSRSVEPLALEPARCRAFYAAYRRFAQMLREPRYALQVHLREGEMVVFDNHRVLHGRTAFSSARHPRHLRGCYLARDSVYGALALLRRRGEHAT